MWAEDTYIYVTVMLYCSLYHCTRQNILIYWKIWRSLLWLGVWKKLSYKHSRPRKLPHDPNYHTQQYPETPLCPLASLSHQMSFLPHHGLVSSQNGQSHRDCYHISRSSWDRLQLPKTPKIFPTDRIQLSCHRSTRRCILTLYNLHLSMRSYELDVRLFSH